MDLLIECLNLPEERVFVGLVKFSRNEDSYDQTVDGDNTRHDNGNYRLHDKFGPHYRHRGNTRSWFRRAIRRSQSYNTQIGKKMLL